MGPLETIGAQLALTELVPSDAGLYHAVVSSVDPANLTHSATTRAARLTLVAAPDAPPAVEPDFVEPASCWESSACTLCAPYI